MAMPYLASPLSLGNLQGVDYLSSVPGMDLPDQPSNFDSETFVRYVFPPSLSEENIVLRPWGDQRR